MKLKSLILGSIAAAGLSTAGFAADLGVLTSLDVCDELGLSGLTISSDTNCLQISGEVKYEFRFGNYNASRVIANTVLNNTVDAFTIDGASALTPQNNDWRSRVETWLKFVGTASSDFGPAKATVVLRQRDYQGFEGNAVTTSDAHPLRIQEGWVSVGDTTVLAAGKKGSIINLGDDEPFNFTGLFISEKADSGVYEGPAATGGHVIQLWSNIGEGLIAKIGLEALERTDNRAGTLVGVLDYAGSGVTAHISGAVGGILDGVSNVGDVYQVHAGVTGTFDQFKVRAAISAGGNSFLNTTYWNGLLSAEAKFDMFKIAASLEGSGSTTFANDYGYGLSAGATVAEGVEINIGGRYFDEGTAGVADGYQIAAQVVAALSETIKATGEIGVYGTTGGAPAATSDLYGKAELAWAPGGGFSSSVGATVQQNGAYKVTFKAAKAFQ